MVLKVEVYCWRGLVRFACLAWLLTGALFASGCGKKDDRVNVSGTVTVQGTPLAKGIVWLHPENGQKAMAMVRSDGTFTATEVSPGELAVAVTEDITDKVPPKNANVKPVTIPEKFKDPKTSGLRFTIGAGSGPISINLD